MRVPTGSAPLKPFPQENAITHSNRNPCRRNADQAGGKSQRFRFSPVIFDSYLTRMVLIGCAEVKDKSRERPSPGSLHVGA